MSFYQDVENKIAYEFKDKNLLERALTHSSYANENRLPPHSDNERLEFLGDAVLELAASEFLYLNFCDLSEGDLSKMRAALVCEPALAGVARKLSLGDHIRLSHGERLSGGHKRDSILSDAVEALLGAMYLDGAQAECRRLIETLILVDIEKRFLQFDSKTRLQELVQAKHTGTLSYLLVGEDGPDHDKTFTMEVHLNERCIGRGAGSSKKHAQQEAAYEALLFLRNHPTVI